LLPDDDADVREVSPREVTPLSKAVGKGHAEVAKLLAERVDSNEGGGAPLLQAAEIGDTGIANLLPDDGADIDGSDEPGMTALHLAACCGRFEMVKLLLANGANVNARNMGGRTPLRLVGDPSLTQKCVPFMPFEGSARAGEYAAVIDTLKAHGGTM
jgi:ankyrin repeat protein